MSFALGFLIFLGVCLVIDLVVARVSSGDEPEGWGTWE